MKDKIKSAVNAVASIAPKKSDEGAAIASKGQMIDEYMNATKPTTAQPAPASSSSGTVINPKAQYGDKPGEKRIDTSDMTKPLGSFKDGTDNVPKTGSYKLHKGEAVLKKEDAASMRKNGYHLVEGALAHQAAPTEPEKPKKELKHILSRKTKDGKVIHEHHFTHPEHHPMEEKVSSDNDELVNHSLEHLGSPNEGEADADAGKSGIESEEKALGYGK